MDEIEYLEFKEVITEAAKGIEHGEYVEDILSDKEISLAIIELAKYYRMES